MSDMDLLAILSTWNPTLLVFVLVGILILKSMLPFVPFPKESIMIFSGLYFGVLVGSVINITGLIVGGLLNFELAYFGHDSLANRMSRITQMKERLQADGWRMLVPLRILPITPQDLTSYASGLSRLPRNQYYWISAIPFTFYGILFAYFGNFSLSWFT